MLDLGERSSLMLLIHEPRINEIYLIMPKKWDLLCIAKRKPKYGMESYLMATAYITGQFFLGSTLGRVQG